MFLKSKTAKIIRYIPSISHLLKKRSIAQTKSRNFERFLLFCFSSCAATKQGALQYGVIVGSDNPQEAASMTEEKLPFPGALKNAVCGGTLKKSPGDGLSVIRQSAE